MQILASITNIIVALLLKFFCLVTLTDYEVLKLCPQREKTAVFHTFLAFVCQAIFIWMLLAATLALFLPRENAEIISALVTASVVLMEIKMVSSLWAPQGVLSRGIDPKICGMLMLRVVMALVLANIYAISAELLIFEDAINEQAESENEASNKKLFNYFDARKEDLVALNASHAAEIEMLKKELKMQETEANKFKSRLDDLNAESIELVRLMTVEKKGLEGRPIGMHAKYYEYKNNLGAVKKMIEKISVDWAVAQTQVDSTRKFMNEIQQKKHDLDTSLPDYDSRTLAATHPDFKKTVPTGLAERYRLLGTLKRDSIHGSTVMFFSVSATLFMMVIELMPLLCKMFFSPASLYHEYLTSETKASAVAIRRECIDKCERKYAERYGAVPIRGAGENPVDSAQTKRETKAKSRLALTKLKALEEEQI